MNKDCCDSRNIKYDSVPSPCGVIEYQMLIAISATLSGVYIQPQERTEATLHQ